MSSFTVGTTLCSGSEEPFPLACLPSFWGGFRDCPAYARIHVINEFSIRQFETNRRRIMQAIDMHRESLAYPPIFCAGSQSPGKDMPTAPGPDVPPTKKPAPKTKKKK